MKKAILALAVLFLASTAEAVVLGASPSPLAFKGTRGGSYLKHLTVSTTDESLQCQVSVSGEIEKWVELGATSFTLQGGRYQLPVRVRVPEAMPNGVYAGKILLRVSSAPSDVGGTGLSVVPGISVKVLVEVKGEEGLWFRVLRVGVYNAKEGDPVKTEVMVKNSAARPMIPSITIEALSYDKKTAYSKSTLARETVDAQSRETVTTYLPSTGMKPGLYWMHFRAEFEGEELWDSLETFYVLEAGKIPAASNASAGGEPTVIIHGVLDDAFVSIGNPVLGENVEVQADFRNIGEVPLDAKLRVDFIKDGRVFASKTGSNEYLEPGGAKRMNLMYKPAEQGEYTVRIWVEYAGLRTAVREAKITRGPCLTSTSTSTS